MQADHWVSEFIHFFVSKHYQVGIADNGKNNPPAKKTKQCKTLTKKKQVGCLLPASVAVMGRVGGGGSAGGAKFRREVSASEGGLVYVRGVSA